MGRSDSPCETRSHGEPPILPNLSSGDNPTRGPPFPHASSAHIIPVGIIVISAISLRGKSKTFCSLKNTLESDGEDREKGKRNIYIALRRGRQDGHQGVTVLNMVATQPV